MSIKTDQGQVLFSFEFHHGNCGYDDGEQCRVCGDLSGITGRLDQRIGNSGIFYTGCRRSNCLCTVYRTEKQRKSKWICKTGTVYHHSYFAGGQSGLSDITETASGVIFGSVDAEVMRASETYFFYTALSFPFIAAYDSAASIFRAQDNTRGPMLISMISIVWLQKS